LLVQALGLNPFSLVGFTALSTYPKRAFWSLSIISVNGDGAMERFFWAG
jgi:hypothetical protein